MALRRSLGGLAVVLVLLAGCRQEPGTPDYSGHVGLRPVEEDPGEPLPGPDPLGPGERRMGFGDDSYEGELTEPVRFANYYVFESTFEYELSADRVEGLRSVAVINSGVGWWGGGVFWDDPVDLRDWTTLYLSLKTQPGSEAYDDVNIGMIDADGGEFSVQASEYEDYGPEGTGPYGADGLWHNLAIPLRDIESGGVDLGRITTPFLYGGVGGVSGEVLLMDNIYLSQD